MEEISRGEAEDLADLAAYEQAMKEHLSDPTTYTHEQVGQLLGLDR